jgi:hypothetical protein
MAENKYYAKNAYLNYNTNKKKAQDALESDWEAMSESDQQTWLGNSQFNDASGTDDPTGFHEYRDYFMGEFGSGTNSNSTLFTTVTLGAGSGNDWANRASRTWATT